MSSDIIKLPSIYVYLTGCCHSVCSGGNGSYTCASGSYLSIVNDGYIFIAAAPRHRLVGGIVRRYSSSECDALVPGKCSVGSAQTDTADGDSYFYLTSSALFSRFGCDNGRTRTNSYYLTVIIHDSYGSIATTPDYRIIGRIIGTYGCCKNQCFATFYVSRSSVQTNAADGDNPLLHGNHTSGGFVFNLGGNGSCTRS